MKIIEYEEKYQEEVKDLLVELQEYISTLDKEKYNIITKEYRDEYFKKTIAEVNKYKGKIFLAIDNNKVLGIVVGLINNDEIETYDFKAPKRGRITELIISTNYRKQGIGNKLLNKMENYFKEVGCKGVLLGVFSYNENAKSFYKKKGYIERTCELMKKM